MIEKWNNFNIKDTLFSWIYGILLENHSNRSLTSIEKLVNDIETNKTASIKSTLTIDGTTYVFEMRLSK